MVVKKRKNDSMEEEFRKAGFTREEDPQILKKHAQERKKMMKDVLPIWKELEKLTTSSKHRKKRIKK